MEIELRAQNGFFLPIDRDPGDALILPILLT
jgi:hypothetical protein